MSPTPVTIGIPYRDEGQNLTLLAGGLLAALDELPAVVRREVIVCVNGSREGFESTLTAMLAEAGLNKHGFRVITSGEGKLTAMRAIVAQRIERGYLCFVDSDVVIESKVLRLLWEALERDACCKLAYAQPVPVFPDDRNWIHRLLRVHYSLRERVYRRPFFHGRAFMLREWFFDAPGSLDSVRPGVIRRLSLERGPLVDDIAMSRMAVARWGGESIIEVQEANVHFDTPDSLRGLYAGALRVALEVQRLDLLYPEHAHLQERVFTRTWHGHGFKMLSWKLRATHAAYRLLAAAIKRVAALHVWLVKVGLLRIETLWVRVPGTKSFPRIRRAWQRFKQLGAGDRQKP